VSSICPSCPKRVADLFLSLHSALAVKLTTLALKLSPITPEEEAKALYRRSVSSFIFPRIDAFGS